MLLLLLVGIVGVIDNGSRPVCRWRRLVLIPVATHKIGHVVVTVVVVVVVVFVSNMI